MSNPKEQRADGCSIFFTLIAVLLLSGCFILIHQVLQPDNPGKTSLMIDETRALKISEYQKENSSYNAMLLDYHQEHNSSIESVMKKIVETHRSGSNQK